MKTIPFAHVLIIPVIFAFLWAIPVFTSSEFNLGWAVIEFCVLMGTYIMCVHSGLFSFIFHRDRKIT
ncbi:MAG: hypothetical protein RL610_1465 [Pseudomonadota bacterium]